MHRVNTIRAASTFFRTRSVSPGVSPRSPRSSGSSGKEAVSFINHNRSGSSKLDLISPRSSESFNSDFDMSGLIESLDSNVVLNEGKLESAPLKDKLSENKMDLIKLLDQDSELVKKYKKDILAYIDCDQRDENEQSQQYNVKKRLCVIFVLIAFLNEAKKRHVDDSMLQNSITAKEIAIAWMILLEGVLRSLNILPQLEGNIPQDKFPNRRRMDFEMKKDAIPHQVNRVLASYGIGISTETANLFIEQSQQVDPSRHLAYEKPIRESFLKENILLADKINKLERLIDNISPSEDNLEEELFISRLEFSTNYIGAVYMHGLYKMIQKLDIYVKIDPSIMMGSESEILISSSNEYEEKCKEGSREARRCSSLQLFQKSDEQMETKETSSEEGKHYKCIVS